MVVMVYVCSMDSSRGRMVVYMVAAVAVVGWYVRACGSGSSVGVVLLYMLF